MNFFHLLALVMQALALRSTAFAVTVGGKHLSVTITQNSTPGNSGSLSSILAVIGTILSGQPGTFTFGVFVVTITLLQPAADLAKSVVGSTP